MTEGEKARLEEIALDVVLLPEAPLRVLSSKRELEELRKSVKERGILVPILVEEVGEGYRVIAGMRRVLAAREAGLLKVPALIVQESDEWKAWATFAENALREKVNAFDEGRYITMMMAKLGKSQVEMAALLGMSEGWVSDRLRIVEWPSDVREALIQSRIEYSVGRELYRIDDAGTRAMYLRQAVTSGCSARQAMQWRMEWEREKAARASIAARGLLERTGQAEPAEENRCGVCEREVERGTLRVLVLCPACVEAIEQSLRS